MKVAGILDRQGLHGFTPRSHQSLVSLTEDLARIRARGYAIDEQERAEGMRCIAAPIFNVHGEPIAGISVSGPVFRMDQSQSERIGHLVTSAAHRVTEAIGGVPQ